MGWGFCPGAGPRAAAPRRRARRGLLVSCAVSCAGKLLFCCCASRADLGEIVGERFEDLISGLGPGEGPGVLVPGADPRLDVVLQGFDGGVDTAADELVGQ